MSNLKVMELFVLATVTKQGQVISDQSTWCQPGQIRMTPMIEACLIKTGAVLCTSVRLKNGDLGLIIGFKFPTNNKQLGPGGWAIRKGFINTTFHSDTVVKSCGKKLMAFCEDAEPESLKTHFFDQNEKKLAKERLETIKKGLISANTEGGQVKNQNNFMTLIQDQIRNGAYRSVDEITAAHRNIHEFALIHGKKEMLAKFIDQHSPKVERQSAIEILEAFLKERVDMDNIFDLFIDALGKTGIDTPYYRVAYLVATRLLNAKYDKRYGILLAGVPSSGKTRILELLVDIFNGWKYVEASNGYLAEDANPQNTACPIVAMNEMISTSIFKPGQDYSAAKTLLEGRGLEINRKYHSPFTGFEGAMTVMAVNTIPEPYQLSKNSKRSTDLSMHRAALFERTAIVEFTESFSTLTGTKTMPFKAIDLAVAIYGIHKATEKGSEFPYEPYCPPEYGDDPFVYQGLIDKGMNMLAKVGPAGRKQNILHFEAPKNQEVIELKQNLEDANIKLAMMFYYNQTGKKVTLEDFDYVNFVKEFSKRQEEPAPIHEDFAMEQEDGPNEEEYVEIPSTDKMVTNDFVPSVNEIEYQGSCEVLSCEAANVFYDHESTEKVRVEDSINPFQKPVKEEEGRELNDFEMSLINKPTGFPKQEEQAQPEVAANLQQQMQIEGFKEESIKMNRQDSSEKFSVDADELEKAMEKAHEEKTKSLSHFSETDELELFLQEGKYKRRIVGLAYNRENPDIWYLDGTLERELEKRVGYQSAKERLERRFVLERKRLIAQIKQLRVPVSDSGSDLGERIVANANEADRLQETMNDSPYAKSQYVEMKIREEFPEETREIENNWQRFEKFVADYINF